MINEQQFTVIIFLVLLIYLPAFFLVIRHFHKRKEMIPRKHLVMLPVVFALIICIVAIILSGGLPWLIIGGMLATSIIYALVMYAWSFIYYRAMKVGGYTNPKDEKKEDSDCSVPLKQQQGKDEQEA